MSAAGQDVTRTFPDVLTALVRGQDCDVATAGWVMDRILAGDLSPVQVAGFVIALRAKGETVEEITGLAEGMLARATPITVTGDLVDVVGSGGDRANTVNVSTMAAITAAAAGARVVKHGNRSASSACGTADVLEELGVELNLAPERQQAIVDECGICFLFAPHYHPALKHSLVARRELGVATTFNFLGPLANPARPSAQAVGIADLRMAELVAGVLARRGVRGLVFHGGDGLDELTTTTASTVWVINNGQAVRTELDPLDLDVPRARVEDLVGAGPEHNAGVIGDLVAGATGPVRDIVVLNAAATLLAHEGPDPAGDLAAQLRPMVERAGVVLDDGTAAHTLERWVAATRL
ncbi:anthranilate phosphoribosyltransferase [Propionibacteriaceae bacterium Y1700]|uniref:anthranilate phosphoribosyltransferase n=1 Tax=Microlunatus sp. Y1700 TaxID=3418487 RepID=UPI003DA721CF